MQPQLRSIYAETFPSHGVQPKSRNYKPVEVNRVPTFDPRHVPSKDWRSESRATNGSFDMELGLRGRARSAPAGLRWAPRRLLGPDWATKNWNTTYRTGSGKSPREFHEVTQEELLHNLVASVVEREVLDCPYPKTEKKDVLSSTTSDIGTWDLRHGEESNAAYKKILKFDRGLSESWFMDANKPPGSESTYEGMTDPTQIDETIFKVKNRKEIDRQQQLLMSQMQWLMTHEKSRYSYRKIRNLGRSMSDTWMGEYCPKLRPPTPPRMPNGLRRASPTNRQRLRRKECMSRMKPAGKREKSDSDSTYNILAHSDTALVQATPLVFGSVETVPDHFPSGTLLDATTQCALKERVTEAQPSREPPMRRSHFTKFPCPVKNIRLNVDDVRAELRGQRGALRANTADTGKSRMRNI